MSLRGLLVLIILLATAVAALRWLGRPPAPKEALPADAPLVGAFTEAAVQGIDLACTGTPVTLRRDALRGWRVVTPIDAEADPRRVKDVVTALQDARVRKVIAEGAADLAAFGLAPPACTVRVDLGGSSAGLTLRLGRSSPVGRERYATADGTRVVLTDGSVFTNLAREPEAFREKRLIPVESAEITKIAIERPSGRVALAMQDGACRLEAPLVDIGSVGACTDLARAVTSAELSGPFLTPPPHDAQANRLLRLEVTAKGTTAPFVAFVAAAGVSGQRVAWRDGATVAGVVKDTAAAELEQPFERFRDKHIVTFSSPDVRRLTIERGTTPITIERAGESAPWTGSGGFAPFDVDGTRVDAVLDALHDLSAAGFEAAQPASKAVATIAVSGATGELARLAFGHLPLAAGSSEELVWITTPQRPGAIFRVEASSLASVPKDPTDLAPKPTGAAPAAAGR